MDDDSQAALRLGAWAEGREVHFRVWAPGKQQVEVHATDGRSLALVPQPRGFFEGRLAGAGVGFTYRLSVDGGLPFPDPWSHSQPEGVHGPSEVISHAFAWTDARWPGLPAEGNVLYELHVGAATREGTFEALIPLLPGLRALGITAIELMPVASFPGRRNWGYDQTFPFAPQAHYGGPEGLRRLVDAAHALGLGVVVDVVYNHLGPEGNYLANLAPYASQRHRTPWGEALDFDGPAAPVVRELALGSAELWVREYHVDALRLDATHAIHDEGPEHLLVELARRARAAGGQRRVQLFAEDGLNRASLTRAAAEGGVGLDAQWSDDFHHLVRRLVAGDADGYYRDYRGTTQELARVLARNWLYEGEPSDYFGGPRGEDASDQAPSRFIFYLQNHDQIGNRAHGERLASAVSAATYRALSALLLCAPQTPLLFMGQEWGALTPFGFFTDHAPELGRAVREGRRREHAAFSRFVDPALPDPQAHATFQRSQLDWGERSRPGHAGILALHRTLLEARHRHPALRTQAAGRHRARALGRRGLELLRRGEDEDLALVVNFGGRLPLRLPPGASVWLWTEEARFGGRGGPLPQEGDTVTLAGPMAVLVRRPPELQEELALEQWPRPPKG